MAEQLEIAPWLRRAKVRQDMRKLRAARFALALCQCGSAPLPGRRRCERCKVADDYSNAMRKRG